MEQLIQTVAQKANISPEIARLAVETVLNVLKTKLPAPIASQLEGLIEGNVNADDLLGGGGGGLLGSLFGKK